MFPGVEKSNISKCSKFPIPKMRLNMIDIKFPCASSIMKYLNGFEKMTGFYKSFFVHFSQKIYTFNLHNSSQNVSPILLFNGLMVVTNE